MFALDHLYSSVIVCKLSTTDFVKSTSSAYYVLLRHNAFATDNWYLFSDFKGCSSLK